MMTSADIYAIMKVQYILMRRVYKKNQRFFTKNALKALGRKGLR